MAFTLLYHQDVKEDTARLDERLKKRIKSAIENRLATAPHQYGEPLRKTLKGYWKLRVGDYRVVFKITEQEVWILGIGHRKDVYCRGSRRPLHRQSRMEPPPPARLARWVSTKKSGSGRDERNQTLFQTAASLLMSRFAVRSSIMRSCI